MLLSRPSNSFALFSTSTHQQLACSRLTHSSLQLVQGLSPLETSVRLLPQGVVGIVVNVSTGYLVDKVSVQILIGIGGPLTAAASLIMSFSKPSWSYWQGAFVGESLTPILPDGMTFDCCTSTIATDPKFSPLHSLKSHHRRRFLWPKTSTCWRCFQLHCSDGLFCWSGCLCGSCGISNGRQFFQQRKSYARL